MVEMSDKELLLSDTKSILHSLVIPHSSGLPLRHLSNDYFDLEGQQIPWRQLGFPSLVALIKSMPDQIRMFGDFDDSYSLYLYPVRSEETRHIIDMVSAQAKGPKKRPKPKSYNFGSSRRGGSAYNHYYNASTRRPTPVTRQMNGSFSTYRGNNRSNPSSYTPRHVVTYPNRTTSLLPTPKPTLPVSQVPPPTPPNRFQNFTVTKQTNQIPSRPVVPVYPNKGSSNPNVNKIVCSMTNGVTGEEVSVGSALELPDDIKQNIKHMMASSDVLDGLMLFNFDARYKHQFKQSLDFKKFNFQSLADCLKTMPELIKLIPAGTSTFKLMPIQSNGVNGSEDIRVPINESNRPIATNSNASVRPIATNSNASFRPIVTTSTTILTNGHSIAVITTSATSSTFTFVTTTTCSTSSTSRTSNTLSSISNKALNNSICNLNQSITSNQSPVSPKSNDSRSVSSHESLYHNINPKAIQNFRHILTRHENGIPAMNFPDEYQKYFKVSFDSRIWGFTSPMELFYSLPQIFSIQTTDKNDVVLHDSRFVKFEKPKPKPRTDASAVYKLRAIPDIIQARILRLIQMNMPSGLLVSHFVNTYNLNYEPIELSQLRITDSSHLFDVLETGLPIEVKMIDGMKHVFLQSEEKLTDWTVQCCRQSKYIIPIILVDTPLGVALPGDTFKPMQMPAKFECGSNEYIATYISSVISPEEIYLQFKGRDYHTALEKMMMELEFYEMADEDKWSVPYQFLCVGLPVITRFPGDRHWHRARITRLHPNPKRVVTVSFVDYGGIIVTDYKSLRLMRREYLSLPIQSLKVALFGIKPILGEKEGWTVAARDKVLRFSKQYYAIACTLIEKRNGVHFVVLCDTNTVSDIFIHDVLVNDKHALFEDGVIVDADASARAD